MYTDIYYDAMHKQYVIQFHEGGVYEKAVFDHQEDLIRAFPEECDRFNRMNTHSARCPSVEIAPSGGNGVARGHTGPFVQGPKGPQGIQGYNPQRSQHKKFKYKEASLAFALRSYYNKRKL